MSSPGGMHPGQMQASMKSVQRMSAVATARRRQRLAGWLCALAGILLVAVAVSAGMLRGHAQSPAVRNAPDSSPNPAGRQNMASAQTSTANPASTPTEAPDHPAGQPAANAAIDPQKQQVVSEAADLLKMATALKTEVDKTTKDTLSVTVVRKAGEIEQLAHKVRLGTGKG